MEIWGWLVVYVVGFALIQLLLFRYVRGGTTPKDRSPEAASAPKLTGVDGDDAVAEPDRSDDARYCDHCGTRNAGDATFTYCHECLSQL